MKKFIGTLLIIFAILFTIVAFTLVSIGQNDTNYIFTSGFEEGNKEIWDDNDPNPDSTNLIMLHPGPFNKTNNHVMRFRVPAGRGGADLVKILQASYERVYVRWYQMWESGYDFTARNHGSGMHAGNRNYLGVSGRRPQGDDWFSTWLEPADGRLNLYTYYRGMYMDCANPNGQCWGDHFPCWFDEGEHICKKPEHREKILPPILVSGKWYCLEIMIEAGTPVNNDNYADGKLNFWIDGIEYGPWEKLWLRTTPNLKINTLWFDLFHHAEHSVEGILLDDIVVSTEYIGPVKETSVKDIKDSDVSFSPNPFSESTIINYELKIADRVIIDIYNSLGEKITTLVDEFQEAGRHSAVFEVGNLPQSMYYYNIRIGERIESRKLLLVK